ncbi:glycosyl hydrolase 115 family protein [Sphingomonas cannabina]|uniref:glycosyl hydrolase 115 family protein n=1 Tax=Sphingomonas cannabina TaxID=2899123 RepID=UPI001F210AF0|nr:glycosyl hydrolase 115 family protein [Sphingomonas cannabina]UIJ43504.1 glycosyl hydrolase 115 family protein [Sphingomonas cannabina]
MADIIGRRSAGSSRGAAALSKLVLAIIIGLILPLSPAFASPLVSERPSRGGFAVFADGRTTPILYDPQDAPVVAHAATDLAGDIAAVTGVRPTLTASAAPPAGRRAIIVGTLGKSRLIDALAAKGRIDVSRLRGAWESFVIATVRNPAPGLEAALVIAGSDRRGTAFGVYELSEAIGVSPWTWWADVPARRHDALWIKAGTRRFGPPSVKYRGIFINDEDWGLHPWAANTYEPEAGGIGPKTYTRVFELLLRLKANTLWPAMHRVSRPFNDNPLNAKLADEYAIVMGSSHAEPMLRNNVGEWHGPGEFNYAVNRDAVQAYWEKRAETNARYESLWTIGMRGIHDSGMLGAATLQDKVALLDRVIADQRAMLARHVDRDLTRVPQLFMPYKEVLDIYRGGLRVPDDVTIVWPDDNFGYIRQFPNADERKRAGGAGIYYHLSYLGAPLSYLWLPSTSPALVREEMTRAWDAGIRTLWVANVGDIKPAEIGMTQFLEMGWDIERWRGKGQRAFLDDWAGRTFDSTLGSRIGAVLDEYYALNFERRTEHLQWWLPGEKPRRSPLSPAEVAARLARFDALTATLDRIGSDVPREQADAFFELVEYPIRAAAEANRRFFANERYAGLIDSDPAEARAAAAVAASADERIKQLTSRFNNDVAGGKWRFIMAEEPADNQWQQYRQVAQVIAAPGLRAALRDAPQPSPPADTCPSRMIAGPPGAAGWQVEQGLGRSGRALLARTSGAALDIGFDLPSGCRAALGLVPTFPTEGQEGFALDIAVDGGASSTITVPRQAGDKTWTRGVLDNLILVPLPADLAPGEHRVRLRTRQSGLVLDGVMLSREPSEGTTH